MGITRQHNFGHRNKAYKLVVFPFLAANYCVKVRPPQRLQPCLFSTCARMYLIQSDEKQFKMVLVSRSLFGICPSPHTGIDVYCLLY